jgi:hypothetical protein
VFIAWAKFPQKMSQGGLVPDQIVAPAKFIATAGAIDFNCEWFGPELRLCRHQRLVAAWQHMHVVTPPNAPMQRF